MAQNFSQLVRADAAGRPMTVTTILAGSDADVVSRVRAEQPKVVYVAQGSESLFGALASAGGGTILLCADASAVRSGCILGVEPAGGQSRLVVDLGRATRSGLTFDARILRLSRVVR